MKNLFFTIEEMTLKQRPLPKFASGGTITDKDETIQSKTYGKITLTGEVAFPYYLENPTDEEVIYGPTIEAFVAENGTRVFAGVGFDPTASLEEALCGQLLTNTKSFSGLGYEMNVNDDFLADELNIIGMKFVDKKQSWNETAAEANALIAAN